MCKERRCSCKEAAIRRKTKGKLIYKEVGMKKLLALLAVSLFLIAACGGDNTETNAALEDVQAAPCVEVPVDVPSIGILGQRVKSVSDLKVCTVISAGTGIVPEVQQFDDCGNPCYAVVV